MISSSITCLLLLFILVARILVAGNPVDIFHLEANLNVFLVNDVHLLKTVLNVSCGLVMYLVMICIYIYIYLHIYHFEVCVWDEKVIYMMLMSLVMLSQNCW